MPRTPKSASADEPVAPADSTPQAVPRKKTSGQLRKEAAAGKAAQTSNKTASRPTPIRPGDTRELTVQHWSRGRHDPLLTAFVAQHAKGRTVKRTSPKWAGLYQDFLTEPRG